MEQLRALLERLPYGLILALYLAKLGYGYYGFNYGADSPKVARQMELDVAREEVQTLTKKIREAEEFYRALESKRTELRSLAQNLEQMKATLSEQLDVAQLLKMIVTEASKVGLQVEGIRPTTLKIGEYYAEQTFELSYRAVYIQLMVFLERMASSERIVRIESLESRPVSAATAPYVELAGSLEIKAYRYIGSKADELGRATKSATDASGKPAPAATPVPASAPASAPAPAPADPSKGGVS